MKYNKNGEMFFYEDKMLIVGEEVYATECEYAGLLGRITEIRTGEDKDTENEGPDIYCSFYPPILKQDAALLSKMRLGSEDIPLDLVIMAPEMLIPTRAVGAGLPMMKVYAVIEDCIVDGEEHPTKRLFADPKHAEIVMRQLIHGERESGCISEWKTKHFFVEEQYSEQYYTAYYKNEYCFNHYTIYVEEVELSLSVPFAEQMLPVSLGVKYREDIAEQIFPWEISEEVRRTSVNDPALYAMVASLLEKNERYQEEYAEVIAEVAHKLTAEHSKIEEMLKKAKSEGKL